MDYTKSDMHCPHCGTDWPNNLQHEHDMLQTTSFRDTDDGRTVAIIGEPTHLDAKIFVCCKCRKEVSLTAEGDDVAEWFRPVLEEAQP